MLGLEGEGVAVELELASNIEGCNLGNKGLQLGNPVLELLLLVIVCGSVTSGRGALRIGRRSTGRSRGVENVVSVGLEVVGELTLGHHGCDDFVITHWLQDIVRLTKQAAGKDDYIVLILGI